MIDREAAVRNIHQIMNRLRELHASTGVSPQVGFAYELKIQGICDCICDVDGYELGWQMAQEIKRMVKDAA